MGRAFERLATEGFVVLHDRRKPGTKWNIDHVVIGPRGVYVIDAKHLTGRLEVRSSGTVLRPGPKRVYVANRSQHKRVLGMEWQVDWVVEAAGDLVDRYGGVVKPVLCFIGVTLDWGQRPEVVGEKPVLVTWPSRFVKDVSRTGPLTREQIEEIAERIATNLPAAVSAPQ